MSVDSVLDGAFTLLLEKARRREAAAAQEATPAVRPATIVFEWTGGGQPIAVSVDPLTLLSTPTACDPVLVEVPFPSTIVWAHLYAGDAAGRPVPVSAEVDVQLTQFYSFGASIQLYGAGQIPLLATQSSADLSIVGWQTNLVTTDTLIARLRTFTGLATWIALTLQIRPTEVPIGVAGVTDAGGITYTDANGIPYVNRS